MTTAKTDNTGTSQPFQNTPDQIHSHTRTFALKRRDGKLSGLTRNGSLDQGGFLAAWRFELTDTLLKFLASLSENEQKKIHRRPRIMFALVPALGALFEHFVIAFFVVLDDAFQAVIAAHFQSAVVEQASRKSSRETRPLPSRNGWMHRKSRLSAAARMSG